MTPAVLVAKLAKEIREITKNYDFVAEYQPNKSVSVYEQYLPLEKFEQDTYYPLVLVALQRVVSNRKEQISTAEIGLTIGVYGGEENPNGEPRELQTGWLEYGDGWRDLLNLAEHIRQHLLKNPIIAEQFYLVDEIEFVPIDPQPVPFFIGGMVLTYEVATPLF